MCIHQRTLRIYTSPKNYTIFNHKILNNLLNHSHSKVQSIYKNKKNKKKKMQKTSRKSLMKLVTQLV